MNEPALVLADEPTGNLDAASGAAVLALLRGAADDGRAVVLVTHERGGRRGRPDLRLVDGRLERREAARRALALRAPAGCSPPAMAGAALTVASGSPPASTAPPPPTCPTSSPASQRARADVDRVVGALPNVAARSYRLEITDVGARRQRTAVRQGRVGWSPGRRGYAVVAGRDVAGRAGEVVIERGLAQRVGSASATRSSRAASGRCASSGSRWRPTTSPSRSPRRRGCTSRARGSARERPAALRRQRGADLGRTTRARRRAPAAGARRSAQVADLRFVTRGGVRVLIDQAAGIVSRCSSRSRSWRSAPPALDAGGRRAAEVQRRLPAIGVQRALGFTRGAVAARARAARGALRARPPPRWGWRSGALAARGPTGGLLAALNELPPGAALLRRWPSRCWRSSRVVAAASAWPAWRAAGRPTARCCAAATVGEPRRGACASRRRLRGARRAAGAARGAGGCSPPSPRSARRAPSCCSCSRSRRCSPAQGRPGLLGKRYDVHGRLPDARPRVSAVPGVAAAARATRSTAPTPSRSARRSSSSPTRATTPASSPRRWPPGAACARADEAEVGAGLAQALGLGLGATLAVAAASGGEARFRVVGIVRALDDEGRVAYVRPARVLRADPAASPQIVVRLDRGADRARVAARLSALGAPPPRAGGATTRNGAFLGVARRRSCACVAVLDALVCLYALVQGLALTARERRADGRRAARHRRRARDVAALFAGAALAVARAGALLGIASSTWCSRPRSRTWPPATPTCPLGAGRPGASSSAGLAALGLGAAAWMTRRARREPVVAGLREE